MTATILMPSDSETEASVIASCLLNPDHLEKYCENLTLNDFYVTAHIQIFAAILRLYREGIECDLNTLRVEMYNAGVVFSAVHIAALVDSETSQDVNFIIRRLRDLANARGIIGISNAAIKRAQDPTHSSEELLDFVQGEASLLVPHGRPPRSAKNPEQMMDESMDRYNEVMKHPGRLPGIDTGFTRINFATGGLIKKTLSILAARPSMGKTALAMNIARNTAGSGSKVVIFELEMSAGQIWDRIISAETRVGLTRLSMGPLSIDDMEKINDANERMFKLPIIIDDDSSVNVREIQERCAQYRQQLDGLDLVVVDHLQLVQATNLKSNNRNADLGHITSSLKTLAKRMDVAVLLISQLNRDVEKRKPPIPLLSDLRESGNIEQDADLVAFIYRPRYYQIKEDYINQADLIIAKARQGAVGVVPLVFHDVYTWFGSFSSEEPTPR